MSKQLTISERMKSLVCAALVATAFTGPIHLGTSMTIAPPAQAFGWSDIKKGAKKVGGAVKKGAKKAGSAVKKGAKKGAKYAGKGAKKAAKVTGKVAKGTVNAGLAVAAEGAKVATVGGATLIAKGLGKYDSEFRRRADKLRGDIDKAFKVDAIGRGVKKGGKWVGKQAKKSAIVRGVIKDAKAVGSGIKKLAGKLRATAKVPPEKRRGRSSTGHQTGKFKTGLVRDKSFRGVNKKSVARDKSAGNRRPYWKKYRENPRNTKDIQTRKRGDRRMVGRNKGVWGNPVYGSKRKIRKVQGIRLKDIQRRKRSSRRVIGRDKSTFGRPVFGKRRKMNSRRKFNNRSLNRSRRSSNRRSFNRNRRTMDNRSNRRSQSRRTRRMSVNSRS